MLAAVLGGVGQVKPALAGGTNGCDGGASYAYNEGAGNAGVQIFAYTPGPYHSDAYDVSFKVDWFDYSVGRWQSWHSGVYGNPNGGYEVSGDPFAAFVSLALGRKGHNDDVLVNMTVYMSLSRSGLPKCTATGQDFVYVTQ